jgi:predicted nucleotide-binding protein (sugar kinase/HSP70/actin superfamily)
MKATFPHMGNLYIVLKALFNYLDVDIVPPPPITKKTLSLGIRHSPEFACLPLKINIGNFIEAAQLGADTIVMSGGVGPCRFGYFAQVQREILKDLGYKYEVIVLEPPYTHFSELIQKIRYLVPEKSWWQMGKAVKFAWSKARALDIVEQKVQQVRAREYQKGNADIVYRYAIKEIDNAQNIKEIIKTQAKILKELDNISVDKKKYVLKIALVGEIYTVLEPYTTHNIEYHLGALGVEVNRSIYLSEWINNHLLFGLARIRSNKKSIKLASPYLCHFVGGHGQETVGSAVRYAYEGYDGVIQLAPLTCMPEIVAQSILPVVSEKESIPIMTIYFDEQSGEAGMLTRLEAFIDLLGRKNSSRIKESGK